MKKRLFATFFLSHFVLFCFCQCKIDYSNFHVVFEDDFKNYENANSLFSANANNNFNPKWASNYYHGNIVDGPTVLCSNGSFKKARSLVTKDNISIIQDPFDSSDKCVALGYNIHKNGINNIEDPTDLNTYYKSCAVLRGLYNDQDGDCINKLGFKYGIYEIRCKIPIQIGFQSAFWFWSGLWDDQCGTHDVSCDNFNEIDSSANRYASPGWEIDVFEALNHDYIKNNNACNNCESEYKYNFEQWFVSAIQPNNSATLPHNDCNSCLNWYTFLKSRINDEFHTYTFVWLPDKFSIFIDGKEVRTDYNSNSNGSSRGVPNIEMDLLLSTYTQWLPNYDIKTGNVLLTNSSYDINQCYCDGPKNLNFELPYDPLVVDYVRVYKPNTEDYTENIDYKSNVSLSKAIVSINPNFYQSEKNLVSHFFNGLETIFYVENFSPPRNRLAYYVYNNNSFNYNIANTPFLSKNSNIIKCVNGEIFCVDILNKVLKYNYLTNNYQYLNLNSTEDAIKNLEYHDGLNRLYFTNSNNEICYFEKISNAWVYHNTYIVTDRNLISNNSNVTDVLFYTYQNEILSLDVNNNISSISNGPVLMSNISDISRFNNKIFYINNLNEICCLVKNGIWKYEKLDYVKNAISNIKFNSYNNFNFISIKSNNLSLEESTFNNDGNQWMTSSFNHFSDTIPIINYIKLQDQSYLVVLNDKTINYIPNLTCEITNPHCLTMKEVSDCNKFTYLNFKSIVDVRPDKEPLELEIYPNPFSDILTIKTTNKTCDVEIFELLGRRRCFYKLKMETNFDLNLRDLENGLYTILFRFEDGSIIKRKINKIY